MSVIVGMSLLGAASVMAQPVVSGTVGVVSRDIYRGVQTNDQGSVYANARVSNLFDAGGFVDGLFVQGGYNTLDYAKGRGNVGVGYANTQGLWTWEVSANRMYWQENFLVDYTEYTGKVSYAVFDNAELFGEVSYAPNFVGNVDSTYAVAGMNVDLTEKFTAGVAVSGYHYSNFFGNSDTTYHNTALTASYKVWNNVDVFGQYSFGGDLPFNAGTLHNVSNIGVSYSF